DEAPSERANLSRAAKARSRHVKRQSGSGRRVGCPRRTECRRIKTDSMPFFLLSWRALRLGGSPLPPSTEVQTDSMPFFLLSWQPLRLGGSSLAGRAGPFAGTCRLLRRATGSPRQPRRAHRLL